MRTICLEIRDSMTFIPAVAMDTNAIQANDYELEDERTYLLRRAGYSRDGSTIILVNLNDCRASNDPYGWGKSRTMSVAHQFIEEHWVDLKDGDVIDVEFILGETTVKKVSERYEQ